MRLLFTLILVILTAAAAGSPSIANANAGASTTAESGVALRVANREIVRFRASLPGIDAESRQRRAQEQIQFALSRQGAELEVTVVPIPVGRGVLVDGELAFRVLPDDARGEGEAALEATAASAAAALRQAFEERREARSARALVWALLQVALAFALLWPLLWLLKRANRGLHRRLAARAARQVERLQLEGVSLLSGERLLAGLRLLARLLYAACWLLLVFEWLSWSLERFPYTRPFGEGMQQMLLDSFALVGGSLLAALPNLVVAVLIFVLAQFAVSTLRPFFERVEQGGIDLGWLDADTARPTRRLVSLAIWLFALAMAYPYLPGAQTEAFKGLSVLVGLMVSLGASSLVGQAASGLILMYTRTLRAGEFVRVGEHEGTVVEMGTFATRVRTGQGAELTLPNTLVASSVTTNYSRAVKGPGFVLDTTVTIGYDTPWRQVEAMLMLAAARTPGVLDDPKPRVFQTQLSDFYVEYRLVIQARPAEPGPRAQVLSQLHASIQDVFNEFGVQIMSPHYLGDPAQAKLVPRPDWHAAPAVP